MTKQITGRIHSTESFGAVDGPGVRFIVFLQGCHMRCRYCHNPETWACSGGTVRTAEDVFKQALRYRSYWKNGGGITVSGGEALLQMEFVTELFRLAKAEGIHTAIDTAGQPFTFKEPFFSAFAELCSLTDLFILDLKEMDNEKHKGLTGFGNKNILALAKYLSDTGIHMWIRHVLVPGLTDDEAGLLAMRKFLRQLKTIDRVEILPYHAMGVPEWERLHIPYTLNDVNPPTDEEIKRAERIVGIRNNLVVPDTKVGTAVSENTKFTTLSASAAAAQPSV